jgi:hypothetical protein
MGFKKAYIDKKVIKEQYRYNGFEGLKNLFITTEAVIFMADTEFCQEILRTLFMDEDENKIRLKISKILI